MRTWSPVMHLEDMMANRIDQVRPPQDLPSDRGARGEHVHGATRPDLEGDRASQGADFRAEHLGWEETAK